VFLRGKRLSQYLRARRRTRRRPMLRPPYWFRREGRSPLVAFFSNFQLNNSPRPHVVPAEACGRFEKRNGACWKAPRGVKALHLSSVADSMPPVIQIDRYLLREVRPPCAAHVNLKCARVIAVRPSKRFGPCLLKSSPPYGPNRQSRCAPSVRGARRGIAALARSKTLARPLIS